MPRLPNKIIINSGDFAGDAKSMQKAFEGGLVLGEEIISLGKGIAGNKLLKADADQHLVEQEKICEDLHKWMADCIARQRALNDKRRKWLDGELDKMP